ncbi:MAG TPA: hypothetical protein VJ799_04570 [Nitrososphaeraceae archaeon]|nr:hypothetical protein [Nitrososphaeraceae archaeon]
MVVVVVLSVVIAITGIKTPLDKTTIIVASVVRVAGAITRSSAICISDRSHILAYL